jgi:tRNA (guanine-N7-)-methyltransferase
VTIPAQTTRSKDPHNGIITDQQGPHPDLLSVVRHHARHLWRKPCPQHTLDAFHQLQKLLCNHARPLVLDSFCGTGMSTALLARHYPDSLVVGIDQSAHRLGKHQGANLHNYCLLRAEAESFWRCLVEANIQLQAHWILYPNPWPKAAQLKRRIHGHGAFPLLAKLGGSLEMRTNWDVFAAEFAQAATQIGFSGECERFTPSSPLSLFEKKYRERGHQLWRFHGEFCR